MPNRVIMVMPNWKAPSEVFIYRQMQFLYNADRLASIILPYRSDVSNWHQVPVYSLENKDSIREQILRAIKAKLRIKHVGMKEKFIKSVHSSPSETILLHYATLAHELYDVLLQLPHRLFIHVHGGDIEDFYDESYWENLRTLSRHGFFLSNSEESVRRLRRHGIPNDKIILKYLGVEVPKTLPKIHTKTKDITILHLGRLIDCKSPDRTIMAFEKACEQGLEGQLVIAGDGPLKITCELLKVRSAFKDRIHLLGAVSAEEGAKLRADADIFTQHSIVGELTYQTEAFGVSIVEAMAAGLPIVTCPVGGIVEIVVPGITGILTTPGSVDEQASAFLKLANDPALRTEMGVAGWQRVSEKFSIEIERKLLLEIL